MIHGVQTLEDADRPVLALPRRRAAGSSSSVAATSAWRWPRPTSSGAARRRCSSASAQPLGLLDADFGLRVADAMRRHGIDVRCGVDVEGVRAGRVITSDGDARRRPRRARDRRPPALGAGPRRRHRARGRRRHRTSTTTRPRPPTACGRRATAPSRATWSPAHAVHIAARHVRQQPRPRRRHQHGRRRRPLAGRARHGDHASSASWRSSLTGLTERRAVDAGFDAVAVTIEATTHAGYLPDASPMTVRLTAERGTGRLLGAQIVGGPGRPSASTRWPRRSRPG